jgi:hypothetical protein
MHKYSNSEKLVVSRKVNLPKKSKRQKEFLLSVKEQKLTFSDAVESARLIPKSLVAKFQIAGWPDE